MRVASSSKCSLRAWLTHDVIGAAGGGGSHLMGMARQHRHRASGNRPFNAASAASPMTPAPTTRTGSPSRGGARNSPWQAIETGSCRTAPTVRHGVGNRMQHRRMRHHLLGPPSTQVLGEAEGPTTAHDLAVEVETRRRPSSRAVGTRGIDAAVPRRECTGRRRRACRRGDRHPGPASVIGAHDLVAEHERERCPWTSRWETARCYGRRGEGHCHRCHRPTPPPVPMPGPAATARAPRSSKPGKEGSA